MAAAWLNTSVFMAIKLTIGIPRLSYGALERRLVGVAALTTPFARLVILMRTTLLVLRIGVLVVQLSGEYRRAKGLQAQKSRRRRKKGQRSCQRHQKNPHNCDKVAIGSYPLKRSVRVERMIYDKRLVFVATLTTTIARLVILMRTTLLVIRIGILVVQLNVSELINHHRKPNVIYHGKDSRTI